MTTTFSWLHGQMGGRIGSGTVKPDGKCIVWSIGSSPGDVFLKIVVKWDVARGVLSDRVEHGVVLVNAANPRLQHGGGLARAIRDAFGGNDFQAASTMLARLSGPFPAGTCVFQNVPTTGGSVCHVVAPDRKKGERADLITVAVSAAITEAQLRGCHRVLMPMLGAGVYGQDPREVVEAVGRSLSGFSPMQMQQMQRRRPFEVVITARESREWEALKARFMP